VQNVLTYSCKHSKEGRTFFFFLFISVNVCESVSPESRFLGGFC